MEWTCKLNSRLDLASLANRMRRRNNGVTLWAGTLSAHHGPKEALMKMNVPTPHPHSALAVLHVLAVHVGAGAAYMAPDAPWTPFLAMAWAYMAGFSFFRSQGWL